jgi:hypothetical protein
MKLIRIRAARTFYLVLAGIVLFTAACSKDSGNTKSTELQGVAMDAISFSKLPGALITMEYSRKGKTNAIHQTTVNEQGTFNFPQIPADVYNISISSPGYKSMYSNNVDLSIGDPFVAFLPANEHLTVPIGGISGRVTGAKGLPVANANISISAQNEQLTNGYFASVSTNSSGQFFIGAIPLQTTMEFKVRCIAENYDPAFKTNITISQNEMVNIHFQLQQALPASKLFAEGFEDTDQWIMTGMWNIFESNEGVTNILWPSHVKLAPNDVSDARIPAPFKGRKMAWYGSALTGNYLGEQSPYDYELSGGTSLNKNSGSLTSPPINLNGLKEASFNFWTWFEIESVNPNQTGFDLMKVYVIDSQGKNIPLGKLNPYTDPIIPVRKTLPFTSGGFNQSAVWKYQEFDLSEFTGSTIRLSFVFETRDALFNGFRGWMIDEISVIAKGIPKTKSVQVEEPLMER